MDTQKTFQHMIDYRGETANAMGERFKAECIKVGMDADAATLFGAICAIGMELPFDRLIQERESATSPDVQSVLDMVIKIRTAK